MTMRRYTFFRIFPTVPACLLAIILPLIPHPADQTLEALPSQIPLSDTTSFARLTIDPRHNATGTETKSEGLQELTGFSGYYINVPKSCVGKVKCPLVLLLHGGGRSGGQEAIKFQGLSDSSGMIMLAATSIQPGRWDIIQEFVSKTAKYEKAEDGSIKVMEFTSKDVPRLDSAMKYVLANYSIDPERIALVGFSDGGSYSLFFGLRNLHVFSRVAPLSALMPFNMEVDSTDSHIFLSGGIVEGNMARQTLERASSLRKAGHAVRTQIGLRGHVDHVEDEIFVWQWFKDSWDSPSITRAGFDSKDDYVILDSSNTERFKEFWTKLINDKKVAGPQERMKFQVQIPFRIGSEETTVIMTDLERIASAHPEVATLLEEAGLTAHDAMNYRKALVAVALSKVTGMYLTSDTTTAGRSAYFKDISPQSNLGRNINFLNQRKDVSQELQKLGIFTAQ